MKITFVKEIRGNDTNFFTEVDGKYVNGSLHFDEVKAKSYFNLVVENKGKLEFKTVLQEVEIED